MHIQHSQIQNHLKRDSVPRISHHTFQSLCRGAGELTGVGFLQGCEYSFSESENKRRKASEKEAQMLKNEYL
ncbi:hypothetical protein, partial [Anabaena sp. FACHB-83]